MAGLDEPMPEPECLRLSMCRGLEPMPGIGLDGLAQHYSPVYASNHAGGCACPCLPRYMPLAAPMSGSQLGPCWWCRARCQTSADRPTYRLGVYG